MFRIYDVMPGETWEIIANKLGTTVAKLKEINGNGDVIPGMKIVIPRETETAFIKYQVVPGDTMYAIANKYGVDLDDLLELNGLSKFDYIYPNQEILVPSSKSRIYITKNGDSTDTLTRMFNTDMNTLLKENKALYLVPDQLVVYRRETNK